MEEFAFLSVPIAVFVPGQQTGRLAATALDGSARARGWSRNTGLFNHGRSLLSVQDRKQFALKGFRILGGVFWWWRGGSRVCNKGAATLLTYTPFNNLSSSEREEKWEETAKEANTEDEIKTRGGENWKKTEQNEKDLSNSSLATDTDVFLKV